MTYVPYEALSRAEADVILNPSNLPTALRDLTPDQKICLGELVTDAYARGLEAGFSMSDFNGDSPGDVVEAYAAGFEQGKIEQGDK